MIATDLLHQAGQMVDGIRVVANRSSCRAWDCDDTTALRCDSRVDEICDGVDNDCNDALALGFQLDSDQNGLPDNMEIGDSAEIAGYVSPEEIDFDADNQPECTVGEPTTGSTQNTVTFRGGQPFTTPGNDCNNLCVALAPEATFEASAGFEFGLCSALEGFEAGEGLDADRDGYRTAGAFGLPIAEELLDEHVYVLVYGDLTVLNPPPEDGEEDTGLDPIPVWDILPLVLPREQVDIDPETLEPVPSGEPVECDARHWEDLNLLTGEDNLFVLGADLNDAEERQDAKLAQMLQVCIEADTCRALEARGEELPEYCAEHEGAHCAITRLVLSAESDLDLFEDRDADPWEGCLDGNTTAAERAWHPEQAITRSVWSRDRVAQARKLVVEWECYRHFGTFGCPGDLTIPEDFAATWRSPYPTEPRPGGFIDDVAWRFIDTEGLRMDTDLESWFNRYDPVTAPEGLYIGCWGDPRIRGVEPLRQFNVTGGDCDDTEEGGGANRDQSEGPGDLLGVFNDDIAACDTCTDGIDNNCNGLADCAEPACARCFVGQGVGCGAGVCSSGGCSSGGSASTGTLGATGGTSLLLMMLGFGWRRRKAA
jgi:hypothetical protein